MDIQYKIQYYHCKKYNINGHYNKIMKKTKSASLIKISSLACSTKKSMQLETNHINWPRLGCTRSIANLATMRPTKLLYEQQTDATSHLQNPNATIKPGTILKNKVKAIHKSIEQLQNEIRQNKQEGKNKSKDYDEQLKKYQTIRKEIEKNKYIIEKQKQKVGQINNNISMLNQDFISTQMNIQEGLAQKQYCDEVLEQYQREYQNQSSLVMEMLNLESQNIEIKKNIRDIQDSLKIKQEQVSEWKKQIQFDFQQKVIKNKLTQLRIQLMKAEQQTNKFAQKNKLLKIRQILCVCVREHAQRNKMIVTSETVNQQGMEIYVCKNNYYEQFEQRVLNYRNRQRQGEKNKYDVQVVEKYFSILNKIQGLVNNTRHEQNTKINNQYSQQICQMRIKLLENQDKIVENVKRIKQINVELEMVLANESVAIIQHLRQTCGRYQLTQIKQRLKRQKQQHKKRISKIKQVYLVHTTLSKQKFQLKSTDFMNNLSDFNKLKNQHLNQLKISQNIVKNLQMEKSNIENQISLAVSKWSQISCKKEQLKLLYKELSQLNKQIRQAQRIWIQQKQHKASSKLSQLLMPTKRSEILSKNLRQTLKLRINGTTHRNKQNQLKFSNRIEIPTNKKQFQIDDNCKTRRTSVALDQKEKTIKYQKIKSGVKDPLTAVLMCKLVN